jgi:hypothetical protein
MDGLLSNCGHTLSTNIVIGYLVALAVYVSPSIQIDQYDMTIVSGIMDCQIIMI